MNSKTLRLLVFVIVIFLAILVEAIFWKESMAIWDKVFRGSNKSP
jgi:hypothetical protein